MHAYVPFAVLLAATAVVSVRHQAFPTWIAWLSAVLAGAHVVMFMGVAASSGPLVPGRPLTYVLYGLALLWLVSVTTVMAVRASRNAAGLADDRHIERNAG